MQKRDVYTPRSTAARVHVGFRVCILKRMRIYHYTLYQLSVILVKQDHVLWLSRQTALNSTLICDFAQDTCACHAITILGFTQRSCKLLSVRRLSLHVHFVTHAVEA